MKKHLWLIKKISITVTAVLLAFMITATTVAVENSGAISAQFGSKTFEVITKDDGKNTDTEYYKSAYDSIAKLRVDARKIGEELEAEGVVLLKNTNNALPLKEGHRKVSMFGVSSIDPTYGGRGSAQSSSDQKDIIITPPVNPIEGLANAGITANDKLVKFYTDNLATYKRSMGGREGGVAAIKDAPWSAINSADGVASSYAAFGDAAILTLSRVGGEAADVSETGFSDATDGDYLKLSPTELTVLEGMKTAKAAGTFSKIIILLNSSNQIEAKFLEDPAIDAALWIGNAGQDGFNSVGKILSGDITPSGRTADMFWENHKANPVQSNFGDHNYSNSEGYGLKKEPAMFGQHYRKYVVYQEGIYVGYRYAETRYEDVVLKTAKTGDFVYSDVVTYPFGYGLSYTNFEYSNYKVAKNGRHFKVNVDVKNAGSAKGKEVVQIYIQKPYTQYDKENGIEKAAVELVGFAKTDTLDPGKSQTVTIDIDEKYFTSYDASGAKTYILEAGNHYLAVGKNAHDALNNILAAKGKTTADGMDAAGNAGLVKLLDYKKTDVKTYSKSDATDKKITNLFDEADINKYSGKGSNSVKYVSRSDWAGTVTLGDSSSVKLAMTAQMAKEMIAQDDASEIKKDNIAYPKYGVKNGLVLVGMRTDADGKEIPYDDPSWDAFMDQLTFDETAALISTGLRKTGATESVAKPETRDHNGPNGLTEAYAKGQSGLAAKTKDKDGMLKPVYYPCSPIVVASFNADLAKRFGNILGEEALWAGYSGFYGIAINTHRSPYEGRIAEYYSEDPMLTGLMVTQEVLGLQAKGCNAYIKHFALNDQDTNRQGNNVWSNEQTLREIYFKPFEMAVVDGGAKDCMASFSRIGTMNCPTSKPLMTDFLRGECGMKGLVVTDMWMLYMIDYSPVYTLAGCDIPDGDMASKKHFDKYKEGYGEVALAMRESAKRIMYQTAHSNAMNGFDSNTRIKMIMPDWLIAVTVVDCILGALFIASMTWTIVDYILAKKKKRV